MATISTHIGVEFRSSYVHQSGVR